VTESTRKLSLSLLSHTNVGKTTLARTLLRRDVGEVLDQTHVTREATAHILLSTREGAELLLWDTPGFGDSVRLARELGDEPDPLRWVRECQIDARIERARHSSYEAVKSVDAESDVILYLVNAAEYPEDAGYVEAEMQILTWIGKPVLVLLNQTGPPREEELAADEVRWREHLARWKVVRKVIGLDAFTRCWVQEGRLLEEVRDVLDEPARELAGRFVEAWRLERQEVFRESMELFAGELARAAHDEELLVEGAWGNDKNQAMKALAGRLETGSSEVVDRLIALHGLDGRSSVDLRTALADFATSAEKLTPERWGVMGGVATGLLGGLTADIASGGLSFGSGMVLGALAGGAGAAGVAKAYNTVRSGESARVRWTDPVLTRTATHFLLRYLAVAHFGRGRGGWREREAPAFWRREVNAAVESRAVYFRGVWKAARGTNVDLNAQRAALAPLLTGSARDVLARFYPEARHLI